MLITIHINFQYKFVQLFYDWFNSLRLKWRRMSVMASQITGNLSVCPTAVSSWQQQIYQRSALLTLSGDWFNTRSVMTWEHFRHYWPLMRWILPHYSDVIMDAMASLITSLTSVYLTVFIHAQIKENIKVRVTGLCAGNSPETGEFPAQMASNTENVSIWWRHHDHRWISRQIGQWCGALMFTLLLFLASCWTNDRITGDLRHLDAHVMSP